MASARNSRRPAFTLVELLVVIAIIGILGSLATVGVIRWIDRQRNRNTEALLQTVQEVLKRHWTAVIEEAKKEPISAEVMALSGGNADRARILWIKARLTEAFPASFYEVQFPPMFYDHGGLINKNKWIPLIPTDRQRYQKMYQTKITLAASTDRETESAACLLVALSVKRGSAVPLDVDNLPIPPSDTNRVAGTVTPDGIKELVDGWGHPIAFLRFPTTNDKTLAIPTTATPAPPGMTTPPWILQPYDPSTYDSNNFKNGDPLDQRPITTIAGGKKVYLPGQLTNTAWWSTTSTSPCVIVQEVCRFSLIDPTSSSPAKPWSFYTLPIVAARGPDGTWSVKIMEDNTPGGVPGAPWSGTNPPPTPRPTWHTFGDYADMRVLSSGGADPYLYARDNLYSHMQAAPQ